MFASQQNQDPVPIAGNWVKPEWFKTYQTPPQSGLVIFSLDTAAKTALTNDYSVGIIAPLPAAVLHYRRPSRTSGVRGASHARHGMVPWER